MGNKKLIVINVLTLIAFVFVVSIGIYRIEATKDEYGKVEEEAVEKVDEVAEKETLELVESEAEISLHTPAAFIINNNVGSLSLQDIVLTMKNNRTVAETEVEEMEEDLIEAEEDATVIIDRPSPSVTSGNHVTSNQSTTSNYKVETKTNKDQVQKSDNAKTGNNVNENNENKNKAKKDNEKKDDPKQAVNPPENEKEKPKNPPTDSDDKGEAEKPDDSGKPTDPEEGMNPPIEEPIPTDPPEESKKELD
ncbi:hypothetical protein [Oceanobacillus polygoni]|uniref:Uncharacterized protein n=1 Tax=Oceanobacillus polygoni TaxID=1235259 RepID=A0A9X0YSB3_9BACI|nr:hypothetical protein [Oceanobacillus polygoni]MBP2077970.1 hypothetical protein [Oceanobacillus polygoni]